MASTESERSQTAHPAHQEIDGAAPLAAPAAHEDAAPMTSAPRAMEIQPVQIESPPGPVSHDVSLHLTDGPASVDIRMAERGGEIRVTVHTPDHDLANSLRGELPDLVGRLRQSGFQAETWRSQADAGSRRGASDGDSARQNLEDGRKGGRQQHRNPSEEVPSEFSLDQQQIS